MSRDDVRVNLASWEHDSDAYQERNRAQLARSRLAWGVWDIPEDQIHALGDVDGLDGLELGCGGAQFGLRVGALGARVIGLDFSENQLRHAVRNVAEKAARFPLVRGDAEELPFADESFDLVFCDHNTEQSTRPTRLGERLRRSTFGDGGFILADRVRPSWGLSAPRPAEGLAFPLVRASESGPHASSNGSRFGRSLHHAGPSRFA